MIHSDAEGQIWIPVSNHSTGTVELQPNVPIGIVVALSEREGTLCEESEMSSRVPVQQTFMLPIQNPINNERESWHSCCKLCC